MSDEDDLLAAELAFGLLDPADRDAAETRAAHDPAFAVLVERWRDRALAMADTGADTGAGAGTPTPPGLWSRIEAGLPANDRAHRAPRWLVAAGLAVAATIAGVALLRPAPTPGPTAPAPHPLVALLTAPDRRAALAISIAADRRGLTTAPASLHLGTRAAELWVIPAGGTPHSLGLVAARPGWRAVPAPLAALLRPGATLAVSVEPAGGSPTGQPTGPVIASATLSPT